MAAHSELNAWLMPTAAQEEWLRLTALLDSLPDSDVPCRDGDPTAWWPEGKGVHSADTLGAVNGCRRCPLTAECLEYALAADERFGVWGASTPADRKAMRQVSGFRTPAA